MAEALVVEKSERQLRIESWVRFVFPPIAGALCYRVLQPGFWQIPVILLGFGIIALIGNRVALAMGGRLITPAERWRLQMERLKRHAAWVVSLWTFAFLLDLQASLILPMAPLEDVVPMLWFMGPMIVGSAALATLICVIYVRRQACLMDTQQEPLPLQSPWLWLRKIAPFRIISTGAAVVAYFIARPFPAPACVMIFTAAYFAGMILEFFARTRAVKPLPLLWSSFSFAAMLVAGLLLYAIPFALLLGFVEALVNNGLDAVSAIFAAGGFAGGLLLAFGFWGVAKLNGVRDQARSAKR